jgi:hypothetical protein
MPIKFLDEEEQPKPKIRFLDEAKPKSRIKFLDEPAAEQPFSIENAERLQRERVRQRMGVEPTPEYKPKQMPTAVTTEVDGVDITGFGSTLEQSLAQQPEPPKLSIADVAADDELFEKAKAYMKASGGKPLQKDESREEFLDRFLSRRTFIESSAVAGGAPELARLTGGTEETKRAIAEGRELYDLMEDRGGLRPVWDVTRGVLADTPLALISGGVGKVAGSAGLKLATKEASEQALKRAGRVGIGGAEALFGGAIDIQQQRIEQEVAKQFGEEPEELDAVRTGAVMILSGALGYAAFGNKTNPAKAAEQGNNINKALQKKNIVPETPTSPATDMEKALRDPMMDQMDAISEQYKKETGRMLIDTIDPVSDLTDAKIRQDMSDAATRLALKVMEVDPTFVRKPNEKISTAINNVFASLDKIDDVSLERALVAAGISPTDFAMMNKATTSDAARHMQSLSVAARVANTLRRNPEFERKIRNLYEFDETGVGALSKFNEAQQALAREWKAWITSGVDTTARNTLSTGSVLGLESAVRMMEGTAFSIGTALSNSAKGQRGSVLYRGMGDTVKDSFDVYFYMREGGLSTEIVENLLADSPALRNQIMQSLQETGNRQISEVGQFANSLNVVVDSFVRRAVFASSVERQLRRTGKDLYKDFLATNKAVPTPILKQATKDALQTTFSYLPKKSDQNLIASSIERGSASFTADVISFIDKTPFLNFAIPFPRYMSNAAAFSYRYSPLGGISAGEDLFKASKLIQAGEIEKGTLLYRQASEKLVKMTIGTAALASAYEFRQNNKETPWYEVPTTQGTTIDVRPLGPQAAYFAWAETLARIDDGTYSGENIKAAFEASTGLKFKAGSQDTFIDQLVKAYESEDRMRSFFAEGGKFVGNIAGGFTQPFVTKQIFDFINLIRDEGRIARDVQPIDAESVAGQVGQTFVNQIINKIPVLKETLPEAVIPMKNEDLTREGEFFSRLIGFRPVIQRSPEEQEIFRLNINAYTIYGGSSGDRAYDRRFIETANERVQEIVRILINDEQYQALPDVEKNIALTAAIRERTAEARKETKAFFEDNDMRRIYRQRYRKLPTIVRRAINRRYAEDNNGKTIEETGDYFAIDEYETELKGRTGFAAGGVVPSMNEQMSDLLQ